MYLWTGDGAGVSGITTASNSQFENSGSIIIQIGGQNSYGLNVINGGHIINTGNIDAIATSGGRGINMTGVASVIDFTGGTTNVSVFNANGVRVLHGALNINSGAELNVFGDPQDYFIEIELGAEIDSAGLLELGDL